MATAHQSGSPVAAAAAAAPTPDSFDSSASFSPSSSAVAAPDETRLGVRVENGEITQTAQSHIQLLERVIGCTVNCTITVDTVADVPAHLQTLARDCAVSSPGSFY